MRTITFLSAAAIAASALLAGPASAQDKKIINFGSSQAGTLNNQMATALAKVLTEKKGYETRVQPFGGSGPLLALTQQGKLDFVIVNVFELASSLKGAPPFETATPDLRVVSALFQSYVGFLVGKDSPIKTVADMKGKNIPSGFSSAPIIEEMRKALFNNAGLTDGDVTLVPVPNSTRGGDLLQQGRADVAFLSVGSGKVAELEAAMGGVRWVALDTSKDAEAAMQKVMPQAQVVTIEPSPARVGVTAPTPVMGYDFVVVAHKDANPENIKAVVDVLKNHREDLIASLPAFRGTNDKGMVGVPNLPYHDVALATFKEMGLAK